MDTHLSESKGYFLTVVVTGSVLAGILTVVLLGGGVTELGYALVVGLGSVGVILGTYALGRRSGHPHSHAVAEAAVSLGALYLIAVSYRLLTEYGQRSTVEVVGAMGTAIIAGFVIVGLVAALGRYGPSPN